MSLALMAQQCTLPSFWNSMSASTLISHKASIAATPNAWKAAIKRRNAAVMAALKSAQRELTTNDILAIVKKTTPEATREMVSNALRGLHEAHKVIKDVRKATPTTRLAYWRAV